MPCDWSVFFWHWSFQGANPNMDHVIILSPLHCAVSIHAIRTIKIKNFKICSLLFVSSERPRRSPQHGLQQLNRPWSQKHQTSTLPALAWMTQSWLSLVQPSWPWGVTYRRSSAAYPLTFLPSPPLQLICQALKPSSRLLQTWAAAAPCLGLVLQLLVFLASLPTFPHQSSWQGLLSFLCLGVLELRDLCHGDHSLKCLHRCLHKCQTRQLCQVIGHPFLTPPNLGLSPLPQSGPQPPLWIAFRPLSPVTPRHHTTQSLLQPQLATLYPHRWGHTPISFPNKECPFMACHKRLHPNHNSRNSSSTLSPSGNHCLRDISLDRGLFLALNLLSKPSRPIHMDTCPLSLVFLPSTSRCSQASCNHTNKMAISTGLRYPRATSLHRAMYPSSTLRWCQALWRDHLKLYIHKCPRPLSQHPLHLSPTCPIPTNKCPILTNKCPLDFLTNTCCPHSNKSQCLLMLSSFHPTHTCRCQVDPEHKCPLQVSQCLQSHRTTCPPPATPSILPCTHSCLLPHNLTWSQVLRSTYQGVQCHRWPPVHYTPILDSLLYQICPSSPCRCPANPKLSPLTLVECATLEGLQWCLSSRWHPSLQLPNNLRLLSPWPINSPPLCTLQLQELMYLQVPHSSLPPLAHMVHMFPPLST